MKKLLYFLTILLLWTCNNKLPNEEKIKPNILFILVDDLGKEWVSCYGAEDIQTPNIDQLASSGIRFNNVYSMPQCTPTRLALLTGQYPFRNGWVNHWDVPRWGGGAHYDEKKYPALVKKIKNAGYHTAIAGKWQIDDFRVEPDALTKIGFDEYCMWTGYEAENPASAERYQNPYVFTKEGSKTYAEKFGPDIFRDFMIDFINAHKNKPLFMYYPMVLPHGPLVNTPDETATDDLGKHKAMVNYVDKITGELIKAIEKAKIRDNTIIIWTTDNGSTGKMVGTYRGKKVKGAKAKTIEAGICAPFLISWPMQIAPNQVSDALIDFTDILPTCIDLAGGGAPKEWAEISATPIDGQSFKKVLTENAKDSNRAWILSMGGGNKARLTENGVENQYLFRDRVIRNKKYKLYINGKRQAEKFIDLQKDPFEEKNLLDSLTTKEQKEHFAQLSELISTFPQQDADPKYTPNPSQNWDVDISAKSQVWKK